jgi:hypothetical protein
MDKTEILLEYVKAKDVVFGSIKSAAQISKLFEGLEKSIALQLIIDASGSMHRRFISMRHSLVQFIQFIESGVSFLKPGVKIYLNVVYFNCDVGQVFPAITRSDESGDIEGYGFSEVTEGSADAVNSKFPHRAAGGTYMAHALELCKNKIWVNTPDGLEPYVILMTDGQPNDTINGIMKIDVAKTSIIQKYGKQISLCVGIGTTRDYDIDFLTNLSLQAPTIAVGTNEIVDTIRECFLNMTTENEPKDCCLMLDKEQVELPKSDGLVWTETDTHYQLDLGKITVAYQVLFSFKLKNPDDIMVKQHFAFNLAGIPHVVDEPYLIGEPTELHMNMYRMMCIKDIINHINVESNVEDNIKLLKEIETEVNIYALSDTLNEGVKAEWKELLGIIRTKENFLSIGDEATYDLYTSTRTSSINTAALRTLSSTPVYRNVTQVAKKVSYQCPLCRDTVEKPAVYKCGHMFCVDCALGYYVQNGEQCPVCRQDNMAKLGNVKLPIFPEEHDKSGSLMKCLTDKCKNRYHGYNYPCMHVSYCKPCGVQTKGKKCPFEGCGVDIKEYRYYYTNYDTPT